MYYSDNNYDIDKKHKIDKLILYNTEHNMKHKYKLDTFLKKSLDYKSNDDYEKEILKYKEEMYNIEKPILEYKIQYLSKMYPINRLYVEDPTNIKYYGDIENNNMNNNKKDLVRFNEGNHERKYHGG